MSTLFIPWKLAPIYPRNSTKLSKCLKQDLSVAHLLSSMYEAGNYLKILSLTGVEEIKEKT